jgi:hypothetical protein
LKGVCGSRRVELVVTRFLLWKSVGNHVYYTPAQLFVTDVYLCLEEEQRTALLVWSTVCGFGHDERSIRDTMNTPNLEKMGDRPETPAPKHHTARSWDPTPSADESVLSAARTPTGPWEPGELAREREARVSAEACVKVLMHDVMLMRGQAAQAEQRRDRADHEWRAAVAALEVQLADRGFGGFGRERSAMAAEIDSLKNALAAQHEDTRRLRGELDELQRKFDECSADLDRERRNARRLAAIAADHEAHRAVGPCSGDSAHRDAEAEELRRDNASLKSDIRRLEKEKKGRQEDGLESLRDSDQIVALQQEIGALKKSLHQLSSAEGALQGRAAAQHQIAELQGEVAALEETLRKQTRQSVQAQTDAQKEREVSDMKVNALGHALAETLKGKQDLEDKLAALTLRAAEETERLCSLSTNLDSVASVLDELQSHVSGLIFLLGLSARGNAELEQRVHVATQAASESCQRNSQGQQLWEDLQRRHSVKCDEVSQLQRELNTTLRDSSRQATEIQNLWIKVKSLDEQLDTSTGKLNTALRDSSRQATEIQNLLLKVKSLDEQLDTSTGKMSEQVSASKTAQVRLGLIIDRTMEALETLEVQVGGKLRAACLQMMSSAADAQRSAKVQGDSTAWLISHVDQLQTSVLGTEKIVAQLVDASQTHTVEKSAMVSELESLRRISAEAHNRVVQSVADKATDQQTIEELEGKLQEAMTVVEAAAAFKRSLADQVQRIEASREADHDKIQRYAKLIFALEARTRELEAENKTLYGSAAMEGTALRQLLATVEMTESSLNTAMAHSASATTTMQSQWSVLVSECVKQETRAEKHGSALHRLQEQHELLLAELRGREKFIFLMEEQQVSVQEHLLRVEEENRVLKFAAQGHSIVHEIEHSHLEQAISKANTAAHVVVEANSQRQRFEQHYTRCAAHSADTQARLAHLEQTVLQVAGVLEKTLVSASDLLKYRNLITHARTPLFVPTTQSGAMLAVVMAKNVCFLIENAGVPLLARGAAVAEELVIFFSEQFDSWMEELLSLSHDQKDSKVVANGLRSQLSSAQHRILGE